jgi:hypothetical protein
MAMSETIDVEVAWALPAEQCIVALTLPAGVTAHEAVEAAGMIARHGLDGATLRLGVFGKAVQPGHVLRDGDRVEIYRPLLADPKEVRRRRARSGNK